MQAVWHAKQAASHDNATLIHTHAHLRNKSEDRGAERENRVKIVASGRSRWGEGRNGRRLTRPPGEREEWLSKHRLHMNSVIGGTGRVFAYLRIH